MAESIRKIDVNGDLRNIEDNRLICDEVGAVIEIPVLGSAAFKVKQPNEDVSISIRPGVYIGENFQASDGYIATSGLSSASITIGTKSMVANPRVSIGQHVQIGDNVKIDNNIHITEESLGGMTDVEWTSESDMNDFRAKGSYYIHGIKTKADDRLPINTVNSGASFAAHLTVVDGSLQPSDGSTPTEICVTQFLMLSNRLGGDGNMYFRTYTEPKNVEAGKGIWTDWKRMSGSVEGYIFSNTKKMNIDFGYQDKEVGLNYMVDNGTYQGVYINDEALTYQEGSYNAETGNGIASLDPTKIAYVETFIITTINDYAATAKVNEMLGSLGLPQSEQVTRQICQFKQATNVLTGTSSYQKRTCLGNGDEYKTTSNWSEWEEIGSGYPFEFSSNFTGEDGNAKVYFGYNGEGWNDDRSIAINSNVKIGTGVKIGNTSHADNKITIGNNVTIGDDANIGRKVVIRVYEDEDTIPLALGTDLRGEDIFSEYVKTSGVFIGTGVRIWNDNSRNNSITTSSSQAVLHIYHKDGKIHFQCEGKTAEIQLT